LVRDGVVSGSIAIAGEEDEVTFDASTVDEAVLMSAINRSNEAIGPSE
jgi:hypothetical protein